MRRVGRGILLMLPAFLVALAIVPAITMLRDGPTYGGYWPVWDPSGLVDVAVYQRTGALVAAGKPFMDLASIDASWVAAQGHAWALSADLPWLYPPIAAVLSVPLSLVPFGVVAVASVALNVGLLTAILYRFNLRGWRLSLAALACVVVVEPVRDTIGYGQLGIVVVALVVLDVLPGPRIFRRRGLPEGWMTGIATAVKLTPAVVVVADFFGGRRRHAWVAFASFLVATAVGFLALPQASVEYWLGLATSGTSSDAGMQVQLDTNQSVYGAWLRIAGSTSVWTLLACAVVVVVGVVAAVGMYRANQRVLGVCLAGVASLVGSPIAWSHHYVWVVPLALALFGATKLPAWFRWYGLVYCIWVVLAPWQFLPHGGGIEFGYAWWEHALDDLGIAAGVVLLALGIVAARKTRTSSVPVGPYSEKITVSRALRV